MTPTEFSHRSFQFDLPDKACSPAIAIAWLLLVLALPSQAFGQTAEQRFAAGLRERRLYDLSATFCRQRLADPAIDPLEQTDLLLQLAQALVARANALEMNRQPVAWDEARKSLADFLREHPEHSRREVIVVQHALTLLARGQSLRQEWELSSGQSDLKSMASHTLRDAVGELDAAQKLIADDLLPRRQRQHRENELSIAQLLTLQNNIQFQLAQCHFNSALLYGDDEKSTQVDALTQIGERLDQLARRVQPDDPFRFQIEILRVECQRRLGQFDAAQAMLAAIDEQTLTTELRAEYWSERFQLALAHKQSDQAIAWLPQVAAFYTTNPKLCLSLVQLFLAVAGETADKTERQKWQNRAEQTILVLETYHGSYWTRRANLLLLAGASGTTAASSANLVVRLVDELLRKNQADEALRLLDLASGQAVAENRRDAAAGLAFRAAQIQQQIGANQDAADRFRLLAAAFQDQPEAATAHLSACWNLAQLLRLKPEMLADYVGLLREHLATWPTDKTADQAAIWLAPLLNLQGEFREAFSVAASVRPTSTDFGKAVELACAAALSELSRTSTAEPDQLVARATDIERALAQWIERSDEIPTSDQGCSVGQLKLTRTVIALRFLAQDAKAATQELDALLNTPLQPSPHWLGSAIAWRALCRAITGTKIPADEVGQLKLSDSENWLAVVQRSLANENRAAISKLVIEQFEQVKNQIASEDISSQARWAIAMAESTWALGDLDRAVEQFTALAVQHPRLLEVQVRLARTLSSDTSGTWTDRAMAAWRAVANGSQPRSDAWFEAKLGLARLMIRGGHLDDARKFLLYLKTVPPGWDQSSLKKDFETLLAQAQQ